MSGVGPPLPTDAFVALTWKILLYSTDEKRISVKLFRWHAMCLCNGWYKFHKVYLPLVSHRTRVGQIISLHDL